jgi:hypothetical protein
MSGIRRTLLSATQGSIQAAAAQFANTSPVTKPVNIDRTFHGGCGSPAMLDGGASKAAGALARSEHHAGSRSCQALENPSGPSS